MRRYVSLPFIGACTATVMLAGCAGPPGGGEADNAMRGGTATNTPASDQTKPSTASDTASLPDAELSIWYDKAFIEAFQRSYLSNTEIEPRISLEQQQALQKQVLAPKLVAPEKFPGKFDKAVNVLQGLRQKFKEDEQGSAVFDFFLANVYFQQAMTLEQGGQNKPSDDKGDAASHKSKTGQNRKVDKPSARSQPTTTKQEDSQTTTDQTDTADAGNRRDSDHKKRIRQLMEQAIAYYRKATDKYSKFRRAWKNLGTVHMRLANYGAGTKALKRVIELDGETGRVYGLLGYAYSKQSKPLSAEGAYRKAIMLDSNTLDWKRGLARSFFEQERFAEAVALLGQLLKQEPERANLWRLQGKAYLGMKKPMEAAKNFEMVDKLGDASYATLTTLGDIYVNNKLYDPAVAAYTRAMKLQPDGDADRIIRAARVLASQGAYRATAKLTKQIKSVYGQSLQKTQRTAVLKVEARVAVAKGHDDKRAAILERVVKLKPMDGEALMLLGKHYSDRGAIEKAISYYERAGNLDQHEADAKVRKAQLRVRQEKYDAAIRLLRRAQELEYRENVQRYLDQIQRLAKRG